MLSSSSIPRPCASIRNSRWLQEFVILVKLAMPVVFGFIANMMSRVVCVIYVGHLGAEYLAAGALATLFCNVTGFSVFVGLSSAIDTMCAQANGAGNYKKVGLTLQRALAIHSLFVIPLLVLWGCSEYLLVLAKQDPLLSHLASIYIKVLMPSLPLTMVFEAIKRYLQSQGIMRPILVVQIASSCISALLGYLLVYQSPLGFIGAPITLNITGLCNVTGLIVYIRVRNLHVKTWPKLSREVLKGWATYLKLGIPGMLMLCLEWWCYEISALMAGLMSVNSLAAQTLIMNLFNLVYMIPLGLSVAASTRVGNLLGANNADAARLAAKVILVCGILIPVMVQMCVLGARHYVGYIYSSDSTVVQTVAYVMQVAFIFGMADGTQGVAGGVLRGCGKQRIGALVCIGAYYLIDLPLGAVLGFVAKWDIFGIWLGMASGAGSAAVAYVIIVLRTDWPHLAATAHAQQVAEMMISDKETGTESVVVGEYEMMQREKEQKVASDDDDDGREEDV